MSLRRDFEIHKRKIGGNHVIESYWRIDKEVTEFLEKLWYFVGEGSGNEYLVLSTELIT